MEIQCEDTKFYNMYFIYTLYYTELGEYDMYKYWNSTNTNDVHSILLKFFNRLND